MKKYHYLLLLSLVMLMNSCRLIGDIFKAGAVVGVIGVIVVIGIILWVLSMFKSKD